MPDLAQAVPQKPPSSFATLLSSFTKRLENDEWDDATLGEDVVTLTYEQALRSSPRARATKPATSSLPNEPGSHESSHAEGKPHNELEKKHRSASITLRVTAEEQAQLQERAAAAHLSVSAYLRSCIFEAESLRSQVKEALAQMQSSSTTARIASTGEGPLNWRKRILPNWLRRRTAEPRAESPADVS